MSTIPNSSKASSKQTMPPFVIAPIERARGWWLYLWPFQSSKALVVTLCVLAVMSMLWVLVCFLRPAGNRPFSNAGVRTPV